MPDDKENSTQLSWVFGLSNHGKDLDFLDLDLSSDLQVYVDPILFYRSPLKLFNEAHTLIVEFFQRAINYVKEGKGRRAEGMCHFPDAENLLGIATEGSGHGPRHELGKRIYDELVSNRDIQEHGLLFLNEFQFLIDGIAFDLISDAAVQISKSVFLEYTKQQCELHKIKTEEVAVDNIFNFEDDEWDSGHAALPSNPLSGKYFILTPRSIVRRYPEGDYKRFYDEIYRYVLFEKEKTTLWRGLGKKPKITFSNIAEKYRNKKSVVEYVHKNPKSRREFIRKIRPTEETAWLEILAMLEDVNINQVIDVATLEALKGVLKKSGDRRLLDNALPAIKHQLKLKQPKKKIIPELESVTKLTKKKLVLLLGSYKDVEGAKRLKEIEAYLSRNYEVALLKTLEKIRGESLEKTVRRVASMARFVVIEDSYPGGQLFEISALENNGDVCAIVREQGKQSSFMSKGVSGDHANLSEFDYELIPSNGIDEVYLDRAVQWAEKRLADQAEFWKKQYPWS